MPHRVVSKPGRTNARYLRSNMTDAERKIWCKLRAHRFIGVSFRRQMPIGAYIVDFVCLKARLIVEVDDGQHVTEKDAVRDAWLRKQGFCLLRFWNNDVHSNIDGVMQVIANAVAQALPPSLTLRRKGGGNDAAFVESTKPFRRRGVTSPLAGEVDRRSATKAVARGVRNCSDHVEDGA